MTSVFEIFAKLGLDSSDFDKGLNDAKSTLSNMGSAVGSGLGTIAKIGTAAVATASAGIAALGTMAVNGYADYEQLSGGIETLFKTSADAVMGFASEAYKTAGLSSNAYMETVTSFSASLISSLGGDTAKAADMANMAIVDMADNANKMGSSTEAIQNAYQGFAKQNYTMLDNLKLGYGGTKTEMERLLADAEKLTGQKYDVSNFGDIVEAIHAIQTEMGITGTTAKEASETISGSVASMKSAWSNLVAGLANDNADLGQLIDNVVASAETAFNNILPVAERALMGIGQLVTDIAPIIGRKLPELITNLLPQIIDTGAQFIGALGQGILTNLPTMLDMASQVITMFAQGIIDAVPSLLDSAVAVVVKFADMLSKNADKAIDGAITLLETLATAIVKNIPHLLKSLVAVNIELIKAIVATIPEYVNTIKEFFPQIISAITNFGSNVINSVKTFFVNLITNIGESLTQIPTIVSQLFTNTITSVKSFFTSMLSTAKDNFLKLVDSANKGMGDMLHKVVDWLSQLPGKMAYYAGYAIGEFIKFVIQLPSKVSSIFTSVMSAIASFGTNFVNKAREMASNFFNNIVNGLVELPSRMAALGQQLVQAVADLPSRFMEIGSNIVQGIWNGISSGWDWLKRQVKHLTDGLVKGVKDGLKIKSPSRVFMEIGKMVDEGFAKGIIDNENRVMSAMQDLISIPSMDDFGTQTGGAGISAVNAGSATSGYTQIINITSPTALTPYEVARQTRNATRDMFLSMRV